MPNTTPHYNKNIHQISPRCLTHHTQVCYHLTPHPSSTYNEKAEWTQFTKESAVAQITIPTNIHTANIIFTNIILMADNHNIPKDNMHSNCRLLPDHVVCKITHRNNITRAYTCDPILKLLNEGIHCDIHKHKQTLWKEYLDAHWDYSTTRTFFK